VIEIIGAKNSNRWYDSDATVSLAVSILRNMDIEKQVLAAKRIIEIARSYDVEAKDISDYVRTLRRRWYDVDEELCIAMEHLKAANPEIQKKIAIEAINYLCELEK